MWDMDALSAFWRLAEQHARRLAIEDESIEALRHAFNAWIDNPRDEQVRLRFLGEIEYVLAVGASHVENLQGERVAVVERLEQMNARALDFVVEAENTRVLVEQIVAGLRELKGKARAAGCG